jgi:hypothetical protein
MTSVTTTAAKGTPRIFELRPDNWPAAFILAIVISTLAIALLPPKASFWV